MTVFCSVSEILSVHTYTPETWPFTNTGHACAGINKEQTVYYAAGCLVADRSYNIFPPAHVSSWSVIKCRILWHNSCWQTQQGQQYLSNSLSMLHLLLLVRADAVYFLPEMGHVIGAGHVTKKGPIHCDWWKANMGVCVIVFKSPRFPLSRLKRNPRVFNQDSSMSKTLHLTDSETPKKYGH